MNMKIVFLGIGSNLANRQHNLEQAVAGINEVIGHVLQVSSMYETEPWGFQSAEKFLNMVVKSETDLKPLEVLEKIFMIESLLGRVRGPERYSSRLIDIDILLYENLIIEEINLKVPHPLMQERKFVLIPLCEIAPKWIHPLLGKSIEELLESCVDRSEVKKFCPPSP
jgi:2-amino-4-hydroxy-6-hydroxymethyldihydropteridine diphosphokinase